MCFKINQTPGLFITWHNAAETTVQKETIEIVRFLFVCLNTIHELRIISYL